jgi:hypothetical protein
VTADPSESVNLLTTERVDPAHLAIAAALGSRWGSSLALNVRVNLTYPVYFVWIVTTEIYRVRQNDFNV